MRNRKKERGVCVYCGGLANSKDHVPPKCLLEAQARSNLPTIPACTRCNQGFSKDEEYFLAVLAHIGTNPSLVAKIEEGGIVDRALTRSPGFDELINRSLVTVPERGVCFIPDYNRMHRVIQKVAYGIFIVRYARIPALEDIVPVGVLPYNIEDARLAHLLATTHTERFRPKRWTTVQHGVFSHIVVRDGMSDNRLVCIMDFHRTVWGVAYIPNPNSRRCRNLGDGLNRSTDIGRQRGSL